MTPAWLEAMRGRVEAATPGPWIIWDYRGKDVLSTTFLSPTGETYPEAAQGVTIGGRNATLTRYDDSLFIAHARTDLPALLALVETLAGALEEIHLACGRSIIYPTFIANVANEALARYAEGPK